MSKIEERFSQYTRQDSLDNLFDKDGTEFSIRTDAFFDNNYLELKESPLNRVTSITTCKNKLKAQLKFRVPIYQKEPDTIPDDHNALSRTLWLLGYHKDCLNYAWNHSCIKHQITSEAIKARGFGYVVVFASHPEYVEHYGKRIPFKRFYKEKYNLDVMLESEAWEWINGKAA